MSRPNRQRKLGERAVPALIMRLGIVGRASARHKLGQRVESGLHLREGVGDRFGDLTRQRVVRLCGYEGKIGSTDFRRSGHDHAAQVFGAVGAHCSVIPSMSKP
jgi:hypothetical protein